MKNIFKITVLIIFIFSNFLSLFVVKAQSSDVPDVCFTTPEPIIEYKNFVQDVLAEINFKEERQSYTGSSNKLIQSAGGGALALITNVSVVFSAEMNVLSVFTIIQKPYALFRDYKLIDQLSPIIRDKLLEVAFKGKYFASVDSEIKNIIKQRQENLFIQLNKNNIDNYGELITALLFQNFSYKSSLIFGDRVSNNNSDNKYIKFSSENYKFDNIYSDANLFACNADFWEGIDMLTEFPEELSGATKSWQEGSRKIKKVFSSFSLSEEEKEVLNKKGNAIQSQQDRGRMQGNVGSAIGDAATKMRNNADRESIQKGGSNAWDAAGGGLSAVGSAASSAWGAVSNPISSTISNMTTTGDAITSEDMEISTSYQKDKDKQFFFNNMDAAGNTVVAFESQLHGKVGKTSPENITSQIPTLSSQIYNLMDILGGKEEEDGITYNLGQACELQCSNVGGKCRTSDN